MLKNQVNKVNCNNTVYILARKVKQFVLILLWSVLSLKRFLKQYILLLTVPFLFGKSVSTDVSPEVWYCNNSLIKQTIAAALSNDAINQNIDEIQAYLENSLLSYFTESSGKWLVSVSKFHRVSGYIDDAAANSKTFCAINDSTLEIYVVVTRVE